MLAKYALVSLTHFCLRVPLEIVVWIFDTSGNILGKENDFTKYFKESFSLTKILPEY